MAGIICYGFQCSPGETELDSVLSTGPVYFISGDGRIFPPNHFRNILGCLSDYFQRPDHGIESFFIPDKILTRHSFNKLLCVLHIPKDIFYIKRSVPLHIAVASRLMVCLASSLTFRFGTSSTLIPRMSLR